MFKTVEVKRHGFVCVYMSINIADKDLHFILETQLFKERLIEKEGYSLSPNNETEKCKPVKT